MKTSEILTKAKQLIATPDTWLQGDYSTERDGVTCYCALGAIGQVMGAAWYGDVHAHKSANLLRDIVKDEVGEQTFAPYNDSHTHDEVMAVFEKAIYLARIEEGDVIKL